ncbi:MAG: hypothetical protein ACXAEU_04850 [Candidatus Hodarchaeales archaeon]
MYNNKEQSGRTRTSLNLPRPSISSDWPIPLKEADLTPTEQKVYLRLSLEFQLVLDEAPSFQMGAYQWHQVLPDKLQKYGLTSEEWERISGIGDNNNELQDQLAELIEKLELQKE